MAEPLRRHLLDLGVLAESGAPRDDLVALARPEVTVGALGVVLSRLHAAAVPDALPAALGERRPCDLVESARRNLSEGRISSGSLAVPYRRFAPERLVELLEDGLAAVDASAPVVTHGAPTLDRLRGDPVPDALADWQAAALADPHLDLAIATRDVVARLGPASVPVLAAAYEPPRIDPQRLDWYSLALELTGAGRSNP